MKSFIIYVEEQDNDAVNRVLTTLGISPDHSDHTMDDPLEAFSNKDELKKDLPNLKISDTTRAAALSAIDNGKMPLKDFLTLLQGQDSGEALNDPEPPLSPEPSVGFMPGGGTAATPSPMQ